MEDAVENDNDSKGSGMQGNTTDQDSIRASPFPRELHKRYNWSQTSPCTQDPHERAVEDQDLTVVCGARRKKEPVFTLYRKKTACYHCLQGGSLPVPICPPQGVPGPMVPLAVTSDTHKWNPSARYWLLGTAMCGKDDKQGKGRDLGLSQ